MKLHLFGLLAIAGLYAVPAAAQVATGKAIEACVRLDADGDESQTFRLVAGTEPCRLREQRIQWNVAGVPGQAGPQGPKGDMGAPGAPGGQGPIGPQGPQGVTGSTGAQGPKGDTGGTGAPGPKGDLGVQGPAGAPGLQGLAGPKGDAGAPGSAGPKGDVGSQGPQGVAGPQGADGAFGLQGPQGTQGPAGPAGPQGPAGAGSTHRSIVLPLSALDISTVNATFAPTRGFVGGNSTIPVLKFPANGFRTFAYASIVLPSDWNGTDVTIRYSWTSNSTHSGEQPAINWDFWWLGPNTDITAANGHGQTTSQTGVTPLAQQWHVVTNTTATLRTVFDPSGPTTLSLKLEREDDLASDTLTADFDLLGITIEYNVISS